MCYNYLRDIMEILADKLRPKKIDDIIGQKHLVGEGKILTNLVKNKKLFSMIFYGKPGIGKTSIATALVSELEMHYKFSKPGKWENGHVQNIGKPDITFNSFNGGEDNGSDIYGTFEGVEEHKGEI